MSRYVIPMPGDVAPVVVEGPFPLTTEEWSYVTGVLGAMRPGLVIDGGVRSGPDLEVVRPEAPKVIEHDHQGGPDVHTIHEGLRSNAEEAMLREHCAYIHGIPTAHDGPVGALVRAHRLMHGLPTP